MSMRRKIEIVKMSKVSLPSGTSRRSCSDSMVKAGRGEPGGRKPTERDLRPMAIKLRESLRTVAAVCLAVVIWSLPLHAQLDETWTVTVNGESAQVAAAGSFTISNVSSSDRFGADGPGSAPDGRGDDFLRLSGISTVGGITWYVVSDGFRLDDGEDLELTSLDLSARTPPLPTSIRLESTSRVVQLGETLDLAVVGRLGDGGEQDLTGQESWTNYRTTNSRVATVSRDGLLTAHEVGLVGVIAENGGAIANLVVEVVSEVVETTVEGFVVTDTGARVAAADVVTSSGGGAVTDKNGFFSLEVTVPVGDGLSLSVSATVDGEQLGADVANVAMIEGGISDAGVIVIAPSQGPQIPEGFTFLRTDPDSGHDEYVQDQTTIEFVLLPGGDFEMGSPENEQNREDDEGPVHTVTLSPFLMAKHEVTQAQYLFVMEENPSIFRGDPQMPVESVSWAALRDVDGFLARTGLELPSEAQWEYAARGGTRTVFSFGDECNNENLCVPCDTADEFMWYCGNSATSINDKGQPSDHQPQPVGMKQANPFGLHDMHGNVLEWCEDVYNAGFYGSPEAQGLDPVSTTPSESPDFRVLRGGSAIGPDFGFFGTPRGLMDCRSSSRVFDNRGTDFPFTGFRPVAPLR